MGIFGNKNNKEEIVIILDIGSGSVGGAIVSISKNESENKRPIILAQKRTLMRYQNDIDFDKFIFYMTKALKETLDHLFLQRIGGVKKIYCFLGSPWYISETRKIHVEKKEKIITSKNEIKSIIENELKSVTQGYEKKYENTEDKPILMENIILESLINGYKIPNFFDKKASTLDLIVYLSLSPESVLKSVKENVRKIFPHTEIKFSSFMMSFYSAVKEKYKSNNSYLLIDINAEITDVGVVTDGILTSFFSFPIGRNYILRAIMKNKKVNKDQAESIFSLYTSSEIDESKRNEIKQILDKVEKDWKNVFYQSIVEVSKISGYTDIIHLVSHKDSSIFFANILENPNIPLAILGDRKFSVNKISGDELKNLCKVNIGPCDEFLMSEAFCVASLNTL